MIVWAPSPKARRKTLEIKGFLGLERPVFGFDLADPAPQAVGVDPFFFCWKVKKSPYEILRAQKAAIPPLQRAALRHEDLHAALIRGVEVHPLRVHEKRGVVVCERACFCLRTEHLPKESLLRLFLSGHVRPRQGTEIFNFEALSPLDFLNFLQWIFSFFSRFTVQF